MKTEKEIYQIAIRLIQEHGEKAWDEATVRYFDCKSAGDAAGMSEWRRVGKAINKLNETITSDPLN